MPMEWRRLREKEIDHEFLWLAVSTVSIALGVVWLKAGLPAPGCVFHNFTGFACPTCGGTRCLRDFVAGHYWAAFVWNPLVFCVLVWTVLFDLYAILVLFLRLPRARISHVSSGTATGLRVVAVAMIAANWMYLIAAGR